MVKAQPQLIISSTAAAPARQWPENICTFAVDAAICTSGNQQQVAVSVALLYMAPTARLLLSLLAIAGYYNNGMRYYYAPVAVLLPVSTPCSLVAHDNQLVEHCACDCRSLQATTTMAQGTTACSAPWAAPHLGWGQHQWMT
jgi:hypothetical protein